MIHKYDIIILGLGAIIDDDHSQYLGRVGIGAVFPGQINQNQNSITIQYPVRNTNGQAQVSTSTIKNDLHSNILPMPVTPDRMKQHELILPANTNYRAILVFTFEY